MTFCKTLAEIKAGKYDVIAEERTEKYETSASYSIMVCHGPICIKDIPCARTTWRKKFMEVCEEWG